MKILILNGSPRSQGNTVAMVEAFAQGAREVGHMVAVVDVAQQEVGGCMACEFCHSNGNGVCVQRDDMEQIYPLLREAEMIVLASPIYYHTFSAQLHAAIQRIYALDKPEKLKKAAMLLSSGSDNVYGGALYTYQNSFLDYLGLEDMGIITAWGEQNKSPEKLAQCKALGAALAD